MARRKWNIQTIKEVVEGGSPFIQFGYTGKSKNKKNGDVWTFKGIKWKKENDVIKRVNEQADSIRELVKRRCSNCGFDIDMLGNKLDKKLYSKTGRCLDCTQARDLELMMSGKLEEFTKNTIIRNKLSVAKEFKKNVIESIEYLKKDDSKMEMIHSNGEITTWVGSQNQKLLEEAEKDLEKVSKLIEELEKEINSSK